MNIGGFQKFSMIDYPDKISSIVFTQGCDFRCGYCHNPELIDFKSGSISESEIFDFLETRKGKVDAVVITGGEPCLQKGLVEFISKVKSMGFLVKIDTNGNHTSVLKELLPIVDYIAMDIKAPLDKYSSAVSMNVNMDNILESIKLIIGGSVNYEFRTTVVKDQLSKEDIVEIGSMIKCCKLYVLQKFVRSKHIDSGFLKSESYNEEWFSDVKKELDKVVNICLIR